MPSRILAWLHQTTTVQGLATLALTVVLQLSQSVPLSAVLGTATAALVLLVLPGQGDLAGRIGRLTTAVSIAAVTRSPAAIGAAAQQGLALARAGDLHPDTPVQVLPELGAPTGRLPELGS